MVLPVSLNRVFLDLLVGGKLIPKLEGLIPGRLNLDNHLSKRIKIFDSSLLLFMLRGVNRTKRHLIHTDIMHLLLNLRHVVLISLRSSLLGCYTLHGVGRGPLRWLCLSH